MIRMVNQYFRTTQWSTSQTDMKRNEELPPSTKPIGEVIEAPTHFPEVEGLDPETQKKAQEAVRESLQ